MTRSFKLGERLLQPGERPYVVAEIGINHDGDLDQAKRSIEAAANAGASAAKFQTFRAEEFMADRNVQYEYESNGRTVSESMYEMFKRLELPEQWHRQLKDHCASCGIDFLSSAADTWSADLLARLDVPALKIASEDLINLPLLEYVARLGIPVILSTGMADQEEIRRAVDLLNKGGCPSLMLLHCVSLYPTPDDQANLLRMTSLADAFDLPVGYSDHTQGIEAAVAATALGAVFIEKHFTLDRSLPGPDHAFSADPKELTALIRSVNRVSTQCGDKQIRPSAKEEQVRNQFRRSIVAAAEIVAGSKITREMVCLKRPGTGIAPHLISELVGMQVRRDFAKDEQLNWDDVE